MNSKILFVCNDPSKSKNVEKSRLIMETLFKSKTPTGLPFFKASGVSQHYIMKPYTDIYDIDILKRDYTELVDIVKGNICGLDVSYSGSPYDALIYHSCKKYGDEYIKLFDPECVRTIESILNGSGLFVINDSSVSEYKMAIQLGTGGSEIDRLIQTGFYGPFDIGYGVDNNMVVWIKK